MNQINGNLLPLASIGLSLASFVLLLFTLWLTLSRGQLRMTRPTLIVMGREGPELRPAIILRTMLYATSLRAIAVETMQLHVRHDDGTFVFEFAGYGANDGLTVGSGWYVPQSGIACDHRFLLRRADAAFLFRSGAYRVDVFAGMAGGRRPLKLLETGMALDRAQSAAMAQASDMETHFAWDAEAGVFDASLQRRAAVAPAEARLTG